MDYIKLNRKLVDWEWYGNINTCRLFIHMLLKANWKDGKFEGKVIPRGAFVSSFPKLAEETALTMREIRTAITHLKSTGEVTCRSYSKYTVFTIKNYCLYQMSDMQNDSQATDNRHSNDILTTTIEERKKERNNNNIIVAPPAEPESATITFPEDSFEIRCVDMLIDSCLKTFPNSKVPGDISQKQAWAVHIDRMKRIDERSEEEILQALTYAITDGFWKSNIRSTKKFREKFETLIVQSKGKNRNQPASNKFNNFKQNDYDFGSLEEQLLSR